MQAIERWKHDNGLTVSLYPDEDCESPRNNENLGTMVCWHSRYTLGDKHPFDSPDAFRVWIHSYPKAIVLPLYLYDHSGITMKTTPFNCSWDSGQVGYIYCLPSAIRKEYSTERITKAIRTDVERVLLSEVSEYDTYIRGECYGYVIADANGEEIDSCWGFIGFDYAKESANEAAECSTIVEQP